MRITRAISKKITIRLIVEVLIYAVLVAAYLAVVINFLTGWLKGLFSQHPAVYAFVSIGLMILQSVGLEKLTSALVSSNRRSRN
jgi:hypothetical protein